MIARAHGVIFTAAMMFSLAVARPGLAAIDFPIVYLSAPADDEPRPPAFRTPAAGHPFRNLAADLVLRQPDGSEKVLVAGRQPDKGLLHIIDPCVSLDGKKVYYTHAGRADGYDGTHADIYCITLASGEIQRLTGGPAEWSPPRGGLDYAPHWPRDKTEAEQFRKSGRIVSQDGIWNMSPCEVAGGRIVFTSTRDGVQPTKESFAAPQLYVMDADGSNVKKIGFMNLGGALHPVIGHDGKVYWSSGEMQGHRGDGGNGWAIWSINPDGTGWGPEISALGDNKDPWHFQAVSSDGSLVASQYYDTRSFGTLYVAPPAKGSQSVFGSPVSRENPAQRNGYSRRGQHEINVYNAFQRVGQYSLTPWATSQDYLGENLEGEKPGMVSHPAAAPDNGLLLAWTGDQGDKEIGIYYVADVGEPVPHFSKLIRIADRDDRYEYMPRAVLPYEAIYGHPCPLPQGATADDLPAGSPFAVVGTSSMNWREVTRVNKPHLSALTLQGGNVKDFETAEIEYLAIVLTNPTLSIQAHGASPFEKLENARANEGNYEGFSSEVNERLARFTKLIPLKKYRLKDGSVHYGPNPPADAEPINDLQGDPDTSFAAELPADQAWTFQLLDKDLRALTTAQTWHQMRPGEKRVDCNGCHAHHKPAPFVFDETFAATREYKRLRLTDVELVEYYRDVQPILEKHNVKLGPRDWDDQGKMVGMSYRSRELDWLMDEKFSAQEWATVAAWIDTGMLAAGKYSDSGERVGLKSGRGPFADTQPPTLRLVLPASGDEKPGGEILVGALDPQSGLNTDSLTVTASWKVGDREAGSNLADLFSFDADEWIWSLKTKTPPAGELTVTVADRAGNESAVRRIFHVGGGK